MFGVARNRQTYDNRRVFGLSRYPRHPSSPSPEQSGAGLLDWVDPDSWGSVGKYLHPQNLGLVPPAIGRPPQTGGFAFLAPLAAMVGEALAELTFKTVAVQAAKYGAKAAAGYAAGRVINEVAGGGADFLTPDDITEDDYKYFKRGVRKLGVSADDIRIGKYMLPRLKAAYIRKFRGVARGKGLDTDLTDACCNAVMNAKVFK